MTTIESEDAAQIIMSLIDTPVLKHAMDNATGIGDYVRRAQESAAALSTGEQIILGFARAALGYRGNNDLVDLWLIDDRCRATILETFTRQMVG